MADDARAARYHRLQLLSGAASLAIGAAYLGVVLAHELGHHAHHDVWRALGVQTVLTLSGFAIAHVALTAVAAWWGLRGLADPAGLPWLAVVLGVVGLAALPLTNGYSRRIERAHARTAGP